MTMSLLPRALKGLWRETSQWREAALRAMPGQLGRRLRARQWISRADSAGRRPIIAQDVRVGAFGNLRFGNDLSVGERCSFDNASGEIQLGNGILFNRNVTLGADHGRIVIDDDSIFGPNVVLRAANHGFDLGSPLAPRDLPHIPGEIHVGKGVWIGANVIVLAGTRIGDYSVIGAGAVVRGEIPPHCLAVGVPAHVIRRG